MNSKKINIKNKWRGFAWLVVFLFTGIATAWADGSKDLYPAGVEGVRAFIRSSTSVNSSFPFANEGVHYVYAKAGERIALASSAQGFYHSNYGGDRQRNRERIKLYKPNGDLVPLVYANGNQIYGNIPNRTAELAGPQLFNTTGDQGNRYRPIYYTVPSGGEGVYRVELLGTGTSNAETSILANNNWDQKGESQGVAAWDISVQSGTSFVKGRVYANVLSLSNGNRTGWAESNGFYGKVYILTKDGYTYKVDNNGNNGIYYTFFVNNNGFIDNNGLPLYKSLPQSGTNYLRTRVQNPNLQDTESQITHKIFYTQPDKGLPASAKISYPATKNTSTWLKNTVIKPDVKNIKLIGVEGVEGQVGNKGGEIVFEADAQGQYIIEVESMATPASFPKRTLTGPSRIGENRVLWDGKDGEGNRLPQGTVPAKLTVQLQGAEVHFPFLDMEYNKNGIIIELLDADKLNLASPVDSVVSDIVYWNDEDIPLASNPADGEEAFRRRSDPLNNSHLPTDGGAPGSGISSRVNGHIWGRDGTGHAGLFGDTRSIDTWTFITGEKVSLDTPVTTMVADLYTELSYSVKGVNNAPKGIYGDAIEYTVTAGNYGPSDVVGSKFTFTVPEGVTVTNPSAVTAVISCSNGTLAGATPLAYDATTRVFSAVLDIPNNCKVTYTINGTLGYGYGDQVASATILRPNDVHDPDATNGDLDTPPTDPYYECENNAGGPVSGGCNNIQEVTFLLEKAQFISNPMIYQRMK